MGNPEQIEKTEDSSLVIQFIISVHCKPYFESMCSVTFYEGLKENN